MRVGGQGTAVALALGALALSCSGPPPPATISGTWTGSFIQNSTKGSVTLVISESAGKVTGTASVSTLGDGLLDGTYDRATGRWTGAMDTRDTPLSYLVIVSGTSGTGKFTLFNGTSGDVSISRAH